jgi:hypothetical protein
MHYCIRKLPLSYLSTHNWVDAYVTVDILLLLQPVVPKVVVDQVGRLPDGSTILEEHFRLGSLRSG